jgi:hypothetical protein
MPALGNLVYENQQTHNHESGGDYCCQQKAESFSFHVCPFTRARRRILAIGIGPIVPAELALSLGSLSEKAYQAAEQQCDRHKPPFSQNRQAN